MAAAKQRCKGGGKGEGDEDGGERSGKSMTMGRLSLESRRNVVESRNATAGTELCLKNLPMSGTFSSYSSSSRVEVVCSREEGGR